MISTAGMSPMMALTLVQREEEKFKEGIRNDATSKREIAAFEERIGSITSVEDLMQDYEVFSFVMKSFGMEDQIYAKAMVRKIVTSDIDDSKSLVNKLSDANYKTLNQTLKFNADGNATEGLFSDPDWVASMVDRYVQEQLIADQAVNNPATGEALTFLRDVGTFKNWYNVIANKESANVLRVALGLPESFSSANVDAQKKTFESKMNIEDLQDPEKVQSLLKRYAAIQTANQAAALSASGYGIATLFSSSNSSGAWAPITVDITGISAVKGYRG